MADRKDYRAAYEETECSLRRLAGLCTALHELVLAHTELSKNTPSSNAITTLTAVIVEKAYAAEIEHEAEWLVVTKPASERGS